MSLDIRAGDLLVIGGKEYPILFCGDYSFTPGSTASMRRMCSATASTKRRPAVVDGKRGDPVVEIASMRCMPLDPASEKSRGLILRDVPTAPTDIMETIVDGGSSFYSVVVEKVRKP